MPYGTRSLVKARPMASGPSLLQEWVAAEALWNAAQETSLISPRLASILALVQRRGTQAGSILGSGRLSEHGRYR